MFGIALRHPEGRKVYGHDRIRLLRCRTYGEDFSERRGTALFNTKLPEATAEGVINHLDEGYSKQINTSVVERHNGTSRLRNQRKVRKTLAFSKASRYHRWMSWLSVGFYNFCRAHGSLKVKEDTRVVHRSLAMAAGLTDHIWSTRQWLLCPVLGG